MLLCKKIGTGVLLLLLGTASAQTDGWVAQVKVARGIVQLERAGQRFPAPVGLRLKENDTLLTAANGSVGVIFNDNSVLSMGPNGEVLLERYAYDSTTYQGAFDAFVKRGAVSIEAGNLAQAQPDAVRLKTPQAAVSGKTQHFAVHVEGE